MFDRENIFLPPTFENYLKAIWNLSQEGKVVRVKDLADALNLRGGTVVSGLKNLAQKGLVVHHHYGHIELTQAGKIAAMEVIQKHSVLYDFLRNGLKVDEKTAEMDACSMEHYISKETYHRLIHFLEYIKEKLSMEQLHKFLEEKVNPNTIRLSEVEDDTLVLVKSIEAPKNIKQKLMDLGILPNKLIFKEKEAPLGDPIEIICGGIHISLGKREAEKILVIKKETIKLSKAPRGNFYISFLKASSIQAKKLTDLGIVPGKIVEVLENNEGSIKLKIDGNILILDESIGSFIYLEAYHDKK
ncbi:MAG: FeoA domain-containing protein [Thermoanaerobaculia bacterium]